MLAGKCGCFARKVASDMQVQAKTWASHLIVIPERICSVLPRKSSALRRIAFRATITIPRGTIRTSIRLRTHDGHQLTTSAVDRRRHACRRLGIRPDAQPDANSNSAA